MQGFHYLGALAASTLSAAATLVGLGAVSLRFSRLSRSLPPLGLLMASLLCSLAIATVVGGVMVAFGEFDQSGAAFAVIVVGSVGLVDLVLRIGRSSDRRWAWLLAGAGVALLPWVASVTRPGYPPADTFQWYYANLGGALTQTGGVPQWVVEYREQVRWLPDYVTFNIVSEWYLAIRGGDPARALAEWRVPVAALGFLGIWAVARLWLPRAGAVLVLLAAVTTDFALTKFNAYKPEALGVVASLYATWFVVRGVRDRRWGWILAGGVGFGLSLGVHAIAATSIGLLAAAAALVEWCASRDKGFVAGVLATAAALSVAVAATVGWGLQGRALVAVDAANPELGDGDPTWVFRLLSAGQPLRPPPGLSDQFRWRSGEILGTNLFTQEGVWVWAFLAMGILLAWRAVPGSRRALATLLMWLSLLAAVAAFFALAFDTYVPRHTGLSRMAGYLGIALALAAGSAGLGFVETIRRHGGRTGVAVAGFVTVAIVGLMSVSSSVHGQFESGRVISDPGLEALELIAARSRVGEVVVSNATTRGTIEFFTGRENPLEGRQAFLEEPALLASANEALRLYQRFFEDPVAVLPTLAAGLRPTWVIAVENGERLGAGGVYAPIDLARMRSVPDSQVLLDRGGVLVARLPGSSVLEHDGIGPTQTTRRRVLILGLLWCVAIAGAFAFLNRSAGWTARRVGAGWSARRAGPDRRRPVTQYSPQQPDE